MSFFYISAPIGILVILFAIPWLKDLLISLSTQLLIFGFQKFVRFIKSKRSLDRPIEVENVKNYLRKEFEANTSYLFLTKQQKLENGDTIMTLASSYERYSVVADKCGGIRKAERNKF